ncbi:MAG: M4 family metallopeptidase, partial [Lutisporaceae bacterium]
MKKLLAILLVMVLCLGVVVSAASPEGNISSNDKKTRQLEIIEKMQNNSDNNNKEFKIQWNQEKGIPSFINGKLSEEAVNNDSEAIAFLIENKDMFKLNKGEFKLKNVEKDTLGTSHYKINQLSDGIPVYGAEAIVHTDAEGTVYAINGKIDNTVPEKSWKNMISLNEKKAIEAAAASLGLDSKNQVYGTEPTAQAFVYNNEGEWLPIYYVTLQFMEPYAANMKVFVNAATGDVIKTRNEIQTTATTGTGVSVLGDTRTLNIDLVSSVYYLRDLSRNAQILTYNANYGTSLPGTLFSDTDNVFNASIQKAGVDAHSNAAIVYDYYKNTLGRNSFDNAGAAIKSTVHYSSSYNNAFWNGSQMVYGDGDGTLFIPLCAALDVIGHEFTHAVTSYTADLEYQDQPGALNESMSDVFGYLIEPNDWLMGEDVYTPNIAGDALRSLSNPELYDQPAHMDDYYVTTSDYGGVHTNSGIPNKAFYLAATSINNNTYMSNIYYRALTTYLTTTSDFEDGKAAFEQAATDLYGSTVAQKITDAFVAVGIGGTTPPPVGNDTYEPNGTTTAAYGPLTSATTYNSYIYSSTDIDYYHFTTGATGTIS